LEEAYEWRKGHDRYEYVRTLNPRQFQELRERNIRGEGRFDDLVDAGIRDRSKMPNDKVFIGDHFVHQRMGIRYHVTKIDRNSGDIVIGLAPSHSSP
jgi:hypothetical protein